MMATDPAVLIVGAGPTGLTLACDLARRGVTFRIIDKAPAYFVGSRGKGLQPRSLEVCDDLGIVDRILECGRFHLPFRGYEGAKVLGDRDIHEGREPTPDVPYASSLIIPQWRVEETLRNRFAQSGNAVELGVELVSLEQNEKSVTANLLNQGQEEQIKVSYLVGSDGGHSLVRHALGIGFEGETWATERMFVGDVKVDGLDRDHWHAWPHKELGFMALCPLPSTESFQFQAQISSEETAAPSLERFQQIVDERTGGIGLRLYDATWTSLYRANVRMVDRYRVGRVFLAGDAAHVHSPAGGQGMNTGIQDAYNLGWKLGLATNGAPDWLLNTYEDERLPIAAWMLGITSKLHRQIMPQSGGDAKRDPEFLQLGISYRESRLARDLRPNPGKVAAGDRAPDAPCHRADGTPVRLFDLLRGPHFSLLAFDETEPASTGESLGPDLRKYRITRAGESKSDPQAIIDTDGHAFRAFAVQGTTQFLVRPDGYIGLVTEEHTADSVEAYLNEFWPESSRRSAPGSV